MTCSLRSHLKQQASTSVSSSPSISLDLLFIPTFVPHCFCSDPHVTAAPPAENAAVAMGIFMSEGLEELKSYPIGMNSSIASSYAQSEIRHDGLAALSEFATSANMLGREVQHHSLAGIRVG